jgi:hypothetical protein
LSTSDFCHIGQKVLLGNNIVTVINFPHSNLIVFGESAASMHSRLIDEIKSEFEYNVSQQIYISKEVWNAVTKLKDQNIYILNQLAATLPHQASSLELSKIILEYSMTEKAELNTIVLDALQYEAKKMF